MKTFSNYVADIPRYINNSDSDNVTWATEMINDSLRYLTTKYYFNERSYTVPGGTVAQQQFYNLPPQVKKLINVTINIGGVLWQPKECPTREYWDSLNVINFYQDYPAYFFVYNGQVGIFPIPGTTANVMTLNYKTRIVDLSQADYSTGTVTVTSGTITVTGSGTAFSNSMAGQWFRVPFSTTNAQNGDNQWYQINSVSTGTIMVLKNPYSGSSATGASYTIGEAPLLPEDYQDLPLYRMAVLYYTTRFPDKVKAALYQNQYDIGMKALDEEFGTKTTSVILNDTDVPIVNSNLYQRNIS